MTVPCLEPTLPQTQAVVVQYEEKTSKLSQVASKSERLGPGSQTNNSRALEKVGEEVYRRICKIERLLVDHATHPDTERLLQSSQASVGTLVSSNDSIEVRSLRLCDTPIGHFLAAVPNDSPDASSYNILPDALTLPVATATQFKAASEVPARSSSLQGVAPGEQRKRAARPTPRMLRKYFLAGLPAQTSTPLSMSGEGRSGLGQDTVMLSGVSEDYYAKVCAQLPRLVSQASVDFENMELMSYSEVASIRKEREILLLRAAELEFKIESHRKYREGLKLMVRADPKAPQNLEAMLKAYRKETHILYDLSSVLKRLSKCTAHLLEHNTAILSTQLARCENEKVASEYAQGKVVQKLKEIKELFASGGISVDWQASLDVHQLQETWTREREELLSARERLREKCLMLSDELERLKSIQEVHAGSQRSSEEVEELHREIRILQDKNAKVSGKLAQLQSELDVTRSSYELLSLQSTAISSYESRRATNSSQLTSSEHGAVEAGTQTSEEQADSDLEQWQEDSMRLHHELQLSEAYHDEILDIIAKREKEIASLKAEMDVMESEHAQALDELRKRLDAKDEQIEMLQLKLTALQDTITFQHEQLESGRRSPHKDLILNEETLQILCRLLHLPAFSTKHDERQREAMCAAIQKLQQTQEEHEESERKATELEFELRDRIDQLEAQLHHGEAREKRLEEEHTTLLAEFDHLTQQWSDFSGDRRSFETKLAAHEKQIRDLQGSLVDKQYELQDLGKQYPQANKQNKQEFSNMLGELKDHYDQAIEEEGRRRIDAEAKFRLLANEISTARRMNQVSKFSQTNAP